MESGVAVRGIEVLPEVRVAPVQAAPSLPILSDIVQIEIARNARAPHFDNNPSKWEDFSAE